MVKFLVEHGACVFATTISDHETAAEKCEEDEDGYDGCSEYLYSESLVSISLALSLSLAPTHSVAPSLSISLFPFPSC